MVRNEQLPGAAPRDDTEDRATSSATSLRRHFLLSLGVVTVPWALVLLPLASGQPRAAAFALSPASVLAILLSPSSLPTAMAIALAGTILLWGGVAASTRGRESLLALIGGLVFFAALGIHVAMRQ